MIMIAALLLLQQLPCQNVTMRWGDIPAQEVRCVYVDDISVPYVYSTPQDMIVGVKIGQPRDDWDNNCGRNYTVSLSVGVLAIVYTGFAYPTRLASDVDSERLANAMIRDMQAGAADVVVHVTRAAPLNGRVLEADGSASLGVMVEARLNGVDVTSALTAADGTFTLWVAEDDGPYDLLATGRIQQEGALHRFVAFEADRIPSVIRVIPRDGRQHAITLP